MPATNGPVPTSRKPSGSSSHSGGHSPSASPNSTAHNQRNMNGAPNGVFGGNGMASGIKGLNNGWQVWGGANASSKRGASISSLASVTDGAQQNRSPISDWAKPTQGWEGKDWEVAAENGSKKKDINQLARQRQVSAVQSVVRNGPRSVALNDDALDAAYGTRYGETGYPASPSKPPSFGSASSPFSTQHSALPSPLHYDGTQPAVNGSDVDVTLGLGNLSLSDGYENGQRGKGQNGGAHARGPHMSQPRGAYNPYQQEYGAYYPRDGFVDYGAYGYESYGASTASNGYGAVPAQSMHGHATPSAVFYPEYNASRTLAPPSPYFYSPHPQPMVYHAPQQSHSPLPTPQLSAAAVATAASLSDKKRELQTMQYTLQQQQQQLSHQQSMIMASMRHSPTPSYQGVEYGGQMPMAMGVPIMHGVPNPYMVRGKRSDAELSSQNRSALLEEFRGNKSRKWELRDLFGYIAEFSGDQHGSRFIQQKLESATTEEVSTIFDEIIPKNALQLIKDVFGNYVIQKLFEYGSPTQRTILANTMAGHVLELSLQMYGCRVVQKAVEYITPEQQASFVSELDQEVLRCVKDANGNHVIQKLIERVSPERLNFVVNAFSGSVYELSTHPYGCRVLQRCFEHLGEEQTRPLLDELHKYTINLMQDQFGNYVIQFVLEHGKVEDRLLIVSKLRGQMLHMARHKFASNVCEKALVIADVESRRQLIEEIMTPKQDGINPIVTMMKDQFANYVLQRALVVVDGDQKEVLISKIRPQLVSMRRYSSAYSKHLISIEKLIQEKSPKTAGQDESGQSTPDHSSISIPTNP